MSCTNHDYESTIRELESDIYDRECELETLELESRMMRARMERLEAENQELQKQVDALLLVAEVKERKRLEVIQDVWKHTMEKTG
jgi:predicted RNase H-like nuclease (RuvC/YqgF family)